MHKYLSFFVGFSILISSGCSSPEYPEFKSLENVQFKSVGFDDGEINSRFKADAVFNNPNAIGATVTGMDFDVYIEDLKVTRIVQDVTSEIDANSDFTLPIEFDLPLKSLFKDGKPQLDILFKKKTVPYRLKGSIGVKLGSLTIDIPVDYEDEEPLSL